MNEQQANPTSELWLELGRLSSEIETALQPSGEESEVQDVAAYLLEHGVRFSGQNEGPFSQWLASSFPRLYEIFHGLRIEWSQWIADFEDYDRKKRETVFRVSFNLPKSFATLEDAWDNAEALAPLMPFHVERDDNDDLHLAEAEADYASGLEFNVSQRAIARLADQAGAA